MWYNIFVRRKSMEDSDLMYTLGAEDAQAGMNPREDDPWYVMGYNENRMPHQPVAESLGET
jgi:hypothetical protein